MKIFIIEDDDIICEELSILLSANGYQVITVKDFARVIEEIKENPCQLILLDINLPYEDGFSLCKKITTITSCPIIFVTSRTSQSDELKSILTGGSDFITKPYNKHILLEKIKRALKEANPINYQNMTVKDVTLNLHLSTISYKDHSCELTRNEFRILYYFFMNPDTLISKDELIEYLWNDKYYLDENILVVNINRLRKKLEEIGVSDFIKTIRKVGYQI